MEELHKNKKLSVIYTNEARCRDCYRCVRVCPVNAIRLVKGQAEIDDQKCIVCGTCLKECPQGAKSFRNDLERVKRLLQEEKYVAVSIAPSFPSLFEKWQVNRVPSLLRKLGFYYAAETSEAAYFVAKESAKYIGGDGKSECYTSACPSFINMVEKYFPDEIDSIAPVVSPMIAHGRRLKNKLGGNIKVVFIGPCIAKKEEAERSYNAGAVDYVLTFTELFEWMEEEQIDFRNLEESDFDEFVSGSARMFPLEGGLAKTASMNTDLTHTNNYFVSGYDEINDILSARLGSEIPNFIEAMMCKGGCLNGPGFPSAQNFFESRKRVQEYHRSKDEIEFVDKAVKVDYLTRYYHNRQVVQVEYPEEAIREVLELTGKVTEEDELNCGACGYNSCRANAIAVLQGMAETEMCIPYMRQLGEQRSDKIIETTPNGVVILDKELNIIHVNPAFRKFFMCSNAVLGKRISYLMDPEPFVNLKESGEDKVELNVHHESYKIICHQIIYKIPEVNQFVGIFVNITKNLADIEELDKLKEKTIVKAQQLMDHQIDMAQQLARLLGENTAKGEELVENLIQITSGENIKKSGSGKDWLWNTYTQK